MSQSLSSKERSNPPPRRKSCVACTMAKRRCDLGQPACFRCSQRKMQCRYPARRSPRESRREPSVGEVGLAPSPSVSGFEVSRELAETGLLPAELGNEEPNFDMLDYILDTPGNPIESSFGEADALGRTVFFDPLQHTVRTRLLYLIEGVKAAPRKMVLENQTPWCHPNLYTDEMPRSMQDAQSCCALYIAKNAVNSSAIFKTIEARVSELVAAPMPKLPLEILARTQALLLFQIIRLFDGDISARASAERTSSALELTAYELLSHICSDNIPYSQSLTETLPLHPLASTREFWKSWIFRESARRTFLLALMCIQAYRILSGFPCNNTKCVCNPWTVSAHLWLAKDPVDFSIAWTRKNHFVINNIDFRDVLAEANASDIEEYGKMLLPVWMGVDEAKGWFVSRGGSL